MIATHATAPHVTVEDLESRDARLRRAHGRGWRSIAARALAAVVVGVCTLCVPDMSIVLLLALLAGYTIVSAAAALDAARHVRRVRERTWPLLLYAVVAVAFAGVLLWWPLVASVTLVTLFAAWMAVAGVAELALALRLRGLVPHTALLGAVGVASLAVVGTLLAQPAQAIAFAMRLVGAYALLSGAFLAALAVRLRRDDHRRHDRRRHDRRPAG